MPTSLLADGYGTREECGRRECPPLPLGEGVRGRGSIVSAGEDDGAPSTTSLTRCGEVNRMEGYADGYAFRNFGNLLVSIRN